MMQKLSDAQRRLLSDMVGHNLRRTPQGWFAKGSRAHATATREKLQELRLIRPTRFPDSFELTEEGFQEATR
jgi:hypothetical protein